MQTEVKLSAAIAPAFKVASSLALSAQAGLTVYELRSFQMYSTEFGLENQVPGGLAQVRILQVYQHIQKYKRNIYTNVYNTYQMAV